MRVRLMTAAFAAIALLFVAPPARAQLPPGVQLLTIDKEAAGVCAQANYLGCTFTITIKNPSNKWYGSGPIDFAGPISIVDYSYPEATITSVSGGPLSDGSGVQMTCSGAPILCESSGPVTIPVGSSVSFTLTVSFSGVAQLTGPQIDCVRFASPINEEADCANNGISPIAQPFDLAINKTEDGGPGPVGSATSFTLTPYNFSSGLMPMGATLTIVDELPAGLSLMADPSNSYWSCTPNSGFPVAGPLQIACTHTLGAALTPGTAPLPTITVQAERTAVGVATNCAVILPPHISGVPLTDAKPENNIHCAADATVGEVFDIALTKQMTGVSPWDVGASRFIRLKVSKDNAPYPSAPIPVGTVITITDQVSSYLQLDGSPAAGSMTFGTGSNLWTCSWDAWDANAGTLVTCTHTVTSATWSSSPNLNLPVTPIASQWSASNGAWYELCNEAEAAMSTALDTDPSDNKTKAADACVHIRGFDLGVDKVAVGGTTAWIVGQQQTFRLRGRNLGAPIPPGALVTITDQFPAGFTFDGYSGANWTCTPPAPVQGPVTLTCTYQPAAGVPAGWFPDELLIQATPIAAAENVKNQVQISVTGLPYGASEDRTDNNSDEAVVDARGVDLKITKVAVFAAGAAQTWDLGSQQVFRLRVLRDAGSAAPPVGTVITATDNIPPDFALNGSQGPGAVTFGSGGGAWNCSWGSWSPTGTLVTCTFTVSSAGWTASPNLDLPVTPISAAWDGAQTAGDWRRPCNEAEVSFTPGTDSDASDNKTALVCPRIRGIDLRIEKVAVSPSGGWQVGSEQQYRIRVLNAGAGFTSAAPVGVSDTIPAGMRYDGFIGTDWDCTPLPPMVGPFTLTCYYRAGAVSGSGVEAAMGPGALSSDLLVRVTPLAPGSSTVNTATVQGGGFTYGPQEHKPWDNADDATVNIIQGPAAFSIAKAVSTQSWREGDQQTFTLTVTNTGAPQFSGTLTVVDALPAGFTNVAVVSSGPFNCQVAGTTVTCTWNGTLPIPSGPLGAIVLSAVRADYKASENCAEVRWNSAIKGNACLKLHPPLVDLAISKTMDSSAWSPGSSHDFTLTVTNQTTLKGGLKAPLPSTEQVQVVETFPAGLLYTGYSAPGWTCEPATGGKPKPGPVTITCTRDTLGMPMGAVETIVIHAQADPKSPNQPAAFQNCATVALIKAKGVESAYSDGDASDNSSCVSGVRSVTLVLPGDPFGPVLRGGGDGDMPKMREPGSEAGGRPADLTVRLSPSSREWTPGMIGALDIVVVNNGDVVRKHKLTGHVTVIKVAPPDRSGGRIEYLSASPASRDWSCSVSPDEVVCWTDSDIPSGVQPRIRIMARASALGQEQTCADITLEDGVDSAPGNDRACVILAVREPARPRPAPIPPAPTPPTPLPPHGPTAPTPAPAPPRGPARTPAPAPAQPTPAQPAPALPANPPAAGPASPSQPPPRGPTF